MHIGPILAVALVVSLSLTSVSCTPTGQAPVSAPVDRPIIFIPTTYRDYAPQGAARSWLWSLDTVPAVAPALLETLRTHAVQELKLDPELYRIKQNGERRIVVFEDRSREDTAVAYVVAEEPVPPEILWFWVPM